MPYAITRDGTRLWFETLGAGEPLLLVAGQASDHHVWDAVREDFAGRHQVIVFDHRGTGASGKPRDPPYSTRGFAQDAVAVFDALQIERVHAYGISMGGRVCQWLAIDHPDRVGALVLGATTPGNRNGVPRSAAMQAALRAGDWASMRDTEVSPDWMAAHPDYLARMEAIDRRPIPAFARKLHHDASEAHDSWERLPDVTAPTLVIHGSDDPINPTANAPLLARRIPKAELRIVQGGRHGYFEEFRAEASSAVLDFIARHPLSSR